nr:protein FAR1-related sequence 11 [Tanacetum cinerariifolium]
MDYSKVQRNRASSKCGCKAYMRITLRRENEIFPEEWQVTILNLEHNHELLSMEEVRKMKNAYSYSKKVRGDHGEEYFNNERCRWMVLEIQKRQGGYNHPDPKPVS